MPQEADRIAPTTSLDMTGLDDFFSCHDKPEQQVMTLDEAAKRLNLSERTVQRHLKHGKLKGFKVTGPRGPEWRIYVVSSDDMTASSAEATDDTVFSNIDMTDVESVATEDKTDDRSALTAHALAQFTGFYHDQIETLQEKLEAATYRNGYLEAQLSNSEQQLKLLPDLSAKATKVETLEQQIQQLKAELVAERQTWWTRFGQWFVGKDQGSKIL